MKLSEWSHYRTLGDSFKLLYIVQREDYCTNTIITVHLATRAGVRSPASRRAEI